MKVRHGDILLKKIKKLPKNVKEIKDKTLAYGEFTGHSHRFMDSGVVKRYEADGKIYLELLQASTLIHEEHKPIPVEKGIYEQIQEREYDPFTESARQALD